MSPILPPHQQPIHDAIVSHMQQLGYAKPAAVQKVRAMLRDHPAMKNKDRKPIPPLKQKESTEPLSNNANLPNPNRRVVKPLT